MSVPRSSGACDASRKALLSCVVSLVRFRLYQHLRLGGTILKGQVHHHKWAFT